ncbi:MAG TPA: winged helix DNA-binding domain-containing protein [Candidatus Dormibacteraeota bacterium]
MRARAQRLTRETATATRPATILREVCGLQAQLLSAATLGVRARSAGLDAGKVNRALMEERSIVRTWLMRGTLHVVAAEDLRWLLQLLGPVFVRAGSTRHAQLGLDGDLKNKGVAAIRRILTEEGPLTRYELVDRLRRQHLVLDAKTQAPIHLIGLAALQGVLCLGPDRDDGESTYVLLDDWVAHAPTPSRETALSELARRYFAAYGPATIEDLAAWSGISMREARAAVTGASAGLTDVTIQGRLGFIVKDRRKRLTMPSRPQVRLLPAFDTYLLGYRRRDLAVPPPLQRRLQRGGGWLHPAVVVNGRAIGAWSLRRSAGGGQVVVELSAPIGLATRTGIETEVADIGRFLNRSLTIEIAG